MSNAAVLHAPTHASPHAHDPLHALEDELLAMPPVAALGLRVAGLDDAGRLRLRAPLSANVNDKGCAFGGSLTSLLTLAGWGLISLRLAEAGLDADVFVADSEIRYRAPLYGDLEAVAALADGESWDAFLATLHSRGRARLTVQATVPLPEGGVATESRSRYAAILKR
ncbi:YiiD C-terminal domain-containing protein [Lysobacter brunescens]|uniref:YiiD C-terminal domain-containing protein n=1 Tax=Lysobacter brunescens TaxID=262323 RepID=A0ABW2YBX3_9GAMM